MKTSPYQTKNKVRFITATSLFDGHDASINIMRRILQSSGAEVIHLGHNRSVKEIVDSAIAEDVQGIAVSSYQGGHIEFFKYMYDMLKEQNRSNIKIFGGGGGVIIPREIKELEDYGITKIFSPQDGRELGLQGMINLMLKECDYSVSDNIEHKPSDIDNKDFPAIARLLSYIENNSDSKSDDAISFFDKLDKSTEDINIPVIGITGTGGSGKSSITDEFVRRYTVDFPDKMLGIISIDPSKRKTGGALLGDRIRMNSIYSPGVYMRSFATRNNNLTISNAVTSAVKLLKAVGFDLIIVETSGIGQGDTHIVDVSDLSVYVMTNEYGAATQLEKIDMIDYADIIVLNKFDKPGSEDALRDIKKQYIRSHNLFHQDNEDLPIFGTIASQFNNPGVNSFYYRLLMFLNKNFDVKYDLYYNLPIGTSEKKYIIPTQRSKYLQDIVTAIRNYKAETEHNVELASKLYKLHGSLELIEHKKAKKVIEEKISDLEREFSDECKALVDGWDKLIDKYSQDHFTFSVRDKEITVELFNETLSHTKIPKVILPKYKDWGDLLRWLRTENVPGAFPYTAGVFPFKRKGEDPKRQFAGEGSPVRTNKRFHYLSRNDDAKRLSTAFDSVSLYGEDPDERPDIFGKIGESGVSICCLEDMNKLFDGFDLTNPQTSVSMTINGPAPMMLAMFLNTAIEQEIAKFEKKNGRKPTSEEVEEISDSTLQVVRGTVQADILKEDQAQNTCIFSTDFALKLMGDIQEYFIRKKVKNYYSVSISGYHIAEAGANPISQLAFTLANGFTYVEYYLSRGMKIDDFAPNLSFFFSNGLDPEYSVIGRVARRIWSTAMKYKYNANERSQKLKYHIQTSGRSLHSQEIDFNDIRTTLQALNAFYDNCNSLHTNSYDEAITTPSEESVRRAMAIQMIISKEWGITKNENPLQGTFIIEELTDLVEEAVLLEFERMSERGGVLGSMETQYQRGKIQEESLYYESKKHSGELPVIGVNTYINPEAQQEDKSESITLARASYDEKHGQIGALKEFKEKNKEKSDNALQKLQQTVIDNKNVFEEMMETVKYASLGEISRALYEVGGQYRRNM